MLFSILNKKINIKSNTRMLIAVVFEIMFIWLLSARSVECSCCVELCDYYKLGPTGI
jgi:hypothetical protein